MTNPFSYRDKHVVVTGGATGVGASGFLAAMSTGQLDFSGLV